MKKPNKTKFAILGLLSIKPLSGYEIRGHIKNSLTHFWAESNGQIYPALNLLMKENLIILLDKSNSEKKASNTYAITKLGLKELKNWLKKEDDEKSVHRDENLLKLFFGKNLTKKNSIQRLKNREQKLLKKLDEYFSILKEIQKKSSSPHYIYWDITLKNGISSVQAEINWCKESVKTLKNLET